VIALPLAPVIGPTQDGLDVTRPEEMTAAEIEAYRAQYTGSARGCSTPSSSGSSSAPTCSSATRRARATTRARSSPRARWWSCSGAIHQYTIMAFREGVAYEVRRRQTNGALRSDILDTLSVAFIHSGHRGMYAAASYSDYLRV